MRLLPGSCRVARLEREPMSHRTKSIVVGLLAGALLGAALGWVIGDEDIDEEMPGLAALGPGDYFQLGIGILTLARQFGSMIRG